MSSLRQLTAIMFADIAGYTAVMQEDEVIALQQRSKLRNKLEEVTTKHFGRLLEFRGDGALCSFTSTIEAVRAGMSLQLAMLSTPVVPLRIGLHSGDVVVDGNNIYGDGVNIASRIESFAIAGSILISGKVYDDLKNQKDIQTVPLGSYRLKNVKELVEIFAISNDGLKVPDKNKLEGKGAGLADKKSVEKSIIVLPFLNMSNDAEQEYFSDGLTEELISDLSRIRNVKVISRTTSMQYKGTRKDLKAIGQETGVNYIMEGSVRKHGNNLRITAQLVDAVLDKHLWAETYRGTIDDIFDIQEMVSAKIVDALRMQLTKEEQRILLKRYTDDTAAYQLYLQGRYFWSKRNETALTSAVKHFEKALEKDPGYALAWAGLADTYSLMGEYTNVSRRELFPKQMAAVNKALELDNNLGEAHVSLAISLMLNEWDWKNSEKEFRLGIELSPNYATAHHWYAEWLLFMGRTSEAFHEISLAVELDPVSPGILKDKGIYYYYTGDYNKAINMAMMALELDPSFATSHRLLSLAYQAMGLFDEAIAENEVWRKNTGNNVKSDVGLAQIYAVAGRKAESEKLLSVLTADNIRGSNDLRGMALIYASLGETDMAFLWLDKSYMMHEESLCSMKIDPKMDPIRKDPRFNILLKKIGLE